MIIFDNNTDFLIDESLENKARSVIEGLMKKDFEVSVSFVDEDEIKELNREYRNVERITDVLSFPQFEPEEIARLKDGDLIGDIIICLKRAQEQAEEYGHSFERELCFLCAHGTLHLLGYDHEDESTDCEMFDLQEAILSKVGILR